MRQRNPAMQTTVATKNHRLLYDAPRPDYRFSTDFNTVFDDYVGADTDTISETSTRGNLCRRVNSRGSGIDIKPKRCDRQDKTVLRVLRQYQAFADELISILFRAAHAKKG